MRKDRLITIDETKDFGSVGCYTGKVTVDFVHNQKLPQPIQTTTCFQVSGGYLILTLASKDPNQVSYEVVKGFLEKAAARRRYWFEAINRDFRYSLTAVGAPAPYLHVAERISNNRFKIGGGSAGLEVSWQVTGVRSDPAMVKRPFKPEEDKPECELGRYLDPEAFGQPEERSIEWGRNPAVMQRLKQMRIEAEQRLPSTKDNDR